MGAVKETVKGKPRKKKATPKETKNLVAQISDLMDEISGCIQTKDDDTAKEGKGEEAENIRKAQLLRATQSLLLGAKTILETY